MSLEDEITDSAYKKASFSDNVKAGLIVLGIASALHCMGYTPANPQEFESSYVHSTSTCQSKKKAKKYNKAAEQWTPEQREWVLLSADFTKDYQLNEDELADTVEIHSRRYLRDCDPEDWPFKENYLRVHLSGEQDVLVDWKGGLPTSYVLNKEERTITVKGIYQDLSLWEKEVPY